METATSRVSGPRGPALFDKVARPVYRRLRDGTGYLFFERRFGLDTMGRVELDEFGLAAEERMPYRPSRWFTLPRALPRREVSEGDVFIDLGSGKGRIVFQAARLYPFSRVIGVELVPQLNEIASGNIERNRERLRCQNVDLVVSDAVDYEIPDDVTVAYFGNPFIGETFAAVLRRLLASLERKPRPFRIVYSAPIEHELLVGTGQARVVRRLRGIRPTAHWSRLNSTYTYAVDSPPARPPA